MKKIFRALLIIAVLASFTFTACDSRPSLSWQEQALIAFENAVFMPDPVNALPGAVFANDPDVIEDEEEIEGEGSYGLRSASNPLAPVSPYGWHFSMSMLDRGYNIKTQLEPLVYKYASVYDTIIAGRNMPQRNSMVDLVAKIPLQTYEIPSQNAWHGPYDIPNTPDGTVRFRYSQTGGDRTVLADLVNYYQSSTIKTSVTVFANGDTEFFWYLVHDPEYIYYDIKSVEGHYCRKIGNDFYYYYFVEGQPTYASYIHYNQNGSSRSGTFVNVREGNVSFDYFDGDDKDMTMFQKTHSKEFEALTEILTMVSNGYSMSITNSHATQRRSALIDLEAIDRVTEVWRTAQNAGYYNVDGIRVNPPAGQSGEHYYHVEYQNQVGMPGMTGYLRNEKGWSTDQSIIGSLERGYKLSAYGELIKDGPFFGAIGYSVGLNEQFHNGNNPFRFLENFDTPYLTLNSTIDTELMMTKYGNLSASLDAVRIRNTSNQPLLNTPINLDTAVSHFNSIKNYVMSKQNSMLQ